MKRGTYRPQGQIQTDVLQEGQSIEQFIRKARAGGEPIQATAKITYNDRKDGVLPQHDIRSDRFEIALSATDKIHASEAAKRNSMDFGEMAKAAEKDAQNGKTTGEA